MMILVSKQTFRDTFIESSLLSVSATEQLINQHNMTTTRCVDMTLKTTKVDILGDLEIHALIELL